MGRPSRIKIVRLAAIWNFFRGGHEKLQKTAFFAKNPSPRYFLMGKFFRDRTMRKLSSRGFRKCGTFGSCELFNGSYCCSKSAQGSKSVFVPKNKRCQKKKSRPQFWVFGHAIESALGKPTFFGPDSTPALKTQNCGRVFFLWHRFWMSKKIEILLNFDSQ